MLQEETYRGLLIYEILSSPKKDAIRKDIVIKWLLAEMMCFYCKSHYSVKVLGSVNSQKYDSRGKYLSWLSYISANFSEIYGFFSNSI